jgi:hypothetical protein
MLSRFETFSLGKRYYLAPNLCFGRHLTLAQITTSYIDITLPTELRQAALQETYNFKCGCLVCMWPQDAGKHNPRQSMRCPKACGGVCPLPSEGTFKLAE